MFLTVQSKVSSLSSWVASKLGVTDADAQTGIFLGILIGIGVLVGIGICILKPDLLR